MLGRYQHLLLYVAIAAVMGLSQGCAHRKEIPLMLTAPAPPPPVVAEHPVPSLWPVRPQDFTITSEFGPRVRVGGPNTKWHKGIDLAAPTGTPVRAAAPGQVIFSGVQTGYGNIIILRHTQEYDTAYAHLHQRGVHVGATVKRGVVIGTVGATGNATGPHLHYEVRRHGIAVDPGPYLPR